MYAAKVRRQGTPRSPTPRYPKEPDAKAKTVWRGVGRATAGQRYDIYQRLRVVSETPQK